MKKQQTNVITYEDVPANPTIEFAEKMVEKFKRLKFDEITSIGGGSTIDVAKYVASKLGLWHKAIPTTAGTGSEVTSYAVLTTNGRKETYKVEPPDEYELIPRHLQDLDTLQRISGGLDVLAHVTESILTGNDTAESNMYANLARKMVLQYLPDFVNRIKGSGRKMLEAANYGGRIIEITKTSFIHALSYGLTERYNIPHGLACGIMLSYFDNDAKKLLKQLNIDRHFIMCRVDVDWLIDRAMESERFNNKTFKLTKRKLLRILK